MVAICTFQCNKSGHVILRSNNLGYNTRNSQRLQYLSGNFIPRFETIPFVKFDMEVGDSHVYVLWTLKHNCRGNLWGGGAYSNTTSLPGLSCTNPVWIPLRVPLSPGWPLKVPTSTCVYTSEVLSTQFSVDLSTGNSSTTSKGSPVANECGCGGATTYTWLLTAMGTGRVWPAAGILIIWLPVDSMFPI